MSFFFLLRNRTWIRSLRGRAQHRPAASRFRPRLEALEDRTLPSTFYAATASDLIAAVNAANTAGGANTIVLTAPTTSPYVLTAVNNTTDGANGLPVIFGGTRKIAADNLTIEANGDTIERSAVSGTPAFRLFDVASGGSLTLENMSLQNGFAYGFPYGTNAAAQGGAIRNQGALILSQVSVDFNEALGFFNPAKNGKGSSGDAAGGGIWSSGSLTIENQSLIDYNTVIGAGTGSGYGGGICIAGGTVNISSSTIGGSPLSPGGRNTALGGYNQSTGNYTPFGPAAGYGGGVYVGAGTATFTNDSIRYNSAGSYINDAFEGFYDLGYGGGIYIATAATVYLDSYTLSSTNGNIGEWPAATTDIYGSYTLL